MHSGDFDATSGIISKAVAANAAIHGIVVLPEETAHLFQAWRCVESVLSSAVATCPMWLLSA